LEKLPLVAAILTIVTILAAFGRWLVGLTRAPYETGRRRRD
jgi:hypothetical protein